MLWKYCSGSSNNFSGLRGFFLKGTLNCLLTRLLLDDTPFCVDIHLLVLLLGDRVLIATVDFTLVLFFLFPGDVFSGCTMYMRRCYGNRVAILTGLLWLHLYMVQTNILQSTRYTEKVLFYNVLRTNEQNLRFKLLTL